MKRIIGPNNSLYLSLIIFLSFLVRAIALVTPEVWIDEGTVGVMSLHALQGEFPLFFYGQKFMGAIEAYLYGFFFLLFEPSPFTLELLPTLISILFILLTYFLARKIFGLKVALISALLLSLPPYFLMFWTHEARLHYSLILIFGTLILLLAQKILYREPLPKNSITAIFIVLGLIGGVSWWTNFLIIVYLLPIALLIFFKNKKIIFSKNLLLASSSFFVGSLPLWAFNFLHHFPILGIPESTIFSLAGLSIKLKGLFINALPIVLGLLPPLSKDKFELLGYLILGSIHCTALTYVIYRLRYEFKSRAKLNFQKIKGGELLIFLVLSTIILDLLTGYGVWLNEPCQRYLLPLYSAIPIIVAFFIVEVWSQAKRIAIFLLSVILFFNLVGSIKHTAHPFRWKDSYTIYNGWKIFDPVALGKYRENEQKEDRLIRFLKTKGYKYIYAEETLRKKLTFKSKESLIFSDPYQEIYLKYANCVDSALNPVYLFEGENISFEENLKAIGGTYHKIQAEGGFILYGDFISPPEGRQILPRGLWKGSSNTQPSQVPYAFDGDVGTAWKTEDSQEPGTYYLLDLGKVETVNKISYIPDSYRDVPTGYQVAVSRNGQNWQIVTQVSHYWGPIFWSGPHPMIKIRHGRIESVFPPHSARYIKIILTGEEKNKYWSINEIFVFSPGQEKCSYNPEEKDIRNLISFLEANKLTFVYADHWLSAVIRVKSNWEIQTLTSNHYLDNYGERYPRPNFFSATRINSKTGFILENLNREYFEETLRKLHFPYQKKEFGPVTLYYGMFEQGKSAEIFSKYYWSGTQLLKRQGE